MEETKKAETHLTSAAAFVEGGVQKLVMMLAAYALKTSVRVILQLHVSKEFPVPYVLATHQFEGSHKFPVGANDAELEERMIQHLAAAAAMGRRHFARREGQRNRSSAQGRLLKERATPSCPTLESSPQPITPLSSEALVDPSSASASGFSVSNQHGNSMENWCSNRSIVTVSPKQSSPNSQDRTGPSKPQSFSESIKSKFNAVSMRYKESISKSTSGWKERYFSGNTTMADLGSEVRREVNAGIATVSRMMERLETRYDDRTSSVLNNVEDGSVAESNNQQVPEVGGCNAMTDPKTNTQASRAASSGSV
ncbi:hypothetical protein H0E87_018158 [Populus deltoides]|uniref:Uncharacterized protein n=1 Tax=Populus deltoides TaxID=3696 RepID=A0A8T2Y3A1_POPDE|nr:hypothetical protein H0E87_018158 [Populus deltoides]